MRNFSLLCVVLLVAAALMPLFAAQTDEVDVSPKARAAIDLALKHLALTQNIDGSWSGTAFGKPTAVAALAGLAFMADGHVPGRGEYGDNVAKALDFVLTSSQDNGLLEYSAPHHAMYSHAFSTLFLAEAWGMTSRPDVKEKLKAAVDLIARTQNREGGWRYEPKVADADISVTVCQVVALRAAANAGIAVPRETVDKALAYIRKCRRDDGGFSYQIGGGDSAFPRSAGALLCLVLGDGPDTRGVAGTVEYLKTNAAYSGKYYFYGNYYAAQAIHLAAPADWPAWYGRITDDLVKRQGADGSWTADGEDAAQCAAMAVLILTIPNGYLPLYQR